MLESAVAQPQASLGGGYLHVGVFEMAAAYPFRIVQNHPFADGNKRAGLLSALVFLDMNGEPIGSPDERLFRLIVSVASGEAGKEEIASLFRVLSNGAS